MRIIDVLTSPWAIKLEKLLEIQEIYRTHLRGDKINIKAIEAQIGKPLRNERQGYEVTDGVAVLPVEGVLAKKMNLFMEISGGSSTELIARDFMEAIRDPQVKAIILSIDSPGGTVDGTQELADLIFENKGLIPVVAFSNGIMASAAYWIGSAADSILISGDTVEVGSIGVVATHTDISRMEENAGIKTTEITAGKFKRIASQYAPLSEEGRGNIQEHLDHIYSVFVGDVARNRGREIEQVLSEMADGRIFIGQKAIKNGLVDGVSTLDRLIKRLAAGDAALEIKSYAKEEPKMTLDELKTKFPEHALAIRAEGMEAGKEEAFRLGLEKGRQEGAESERTRIKEVEAQILPGHEKLIADLKFDGKTTGPEAAVKVLAAEKETMKKAHANFVADGQDLAVAQTDPPQPKPAIDPNLPLEDRCKAEWDQKPEIREEFSTYDAYLAFKKAEAAGRVRILRKGGK